MPPWLIETIKLLGTIGGLTAFGILMRDWLAKYQITPRHGQWRPLVKIDEATLRSYEAHPERGDPSRVVTDNNPLIWHMMALMQDARAGRITVYGKRRPARIPTPIPIASLRDRNLSKDFLSLTDGDNEWSDVSVGWWQLRQHIRRVPNINLE